MTHKELSITSYEIPFSGNPTQICNNTIIKSKVNNIRHTMKKTPKYVVHPLLGYVHQRVTSCDFYFVKGLQTATSTLPYFSFYKFQGTFSQSVSHATLNTRYKNPPHNFPTNLTHNHSLSEGSNP